MGRGGRDAARDRGVTPRNHISVAQEPPAAQEKAARAVSLLLLRAMAMAAATTDDAHETMLAFGFPSSVIRECVSTTVGV
jgi:hypothetical protein